MTKQEPVKVHEKDTKTKQKTQFSTRMPSPEVVNDFKKFVKTKYDGHYYSYAGLELDIAIKKHLRDNKVEGYVNQDMDSFYGSSAAHTNLKSPDYFLIEHLKMTYSEGDMVSFRDLANVMRKESNLKDPRTHRSHVDTLEAISILIRVDEGRYDTYYYKKAPEMTITELKNKKVEKNKIYSLLVKENYQGRIISTSQFEKITHLKGQNTENALDELEDLNLIKYISPGLWRVIDTNETPIEKVPTKQNIPISDSEDYLSQLSNAKPAKDGYGVIKRR